MKKVFDIAKDMIRVACICFVFPGVDVDLDHFSAFFGSSNDQAEEK